MREDPKQSEMSENLVNLIDLLIEVRKGESNQAPDPFWEESRKLLLKEMKKKEVQQ